MDNDLKYIIDSYGDTVYRVALSKTCDVDMAQDIYQETFLLLLQKKPHFENTAQLKTWLVRAAVKLSASYRRRAENTKTEPLSDVHPSDGKSPEFELLDLMCCLGESERTVTVLFYIDDMSQSDIAKLLGITTGAVKMRLSRAKKTLKKIYKEEIL